MLLNAVSHSSKQKSRCCAAKCVRPHHATYTPMHFDRRRLGRMEKVQGTRTRLLRSRCKVTFFLKYEHLLAHSKLQLLIHMSMQQRNQSFPTLSLTRMPFRLCHRGDSHIRWNPRRSSRNSNSCQFLRLHFQRRTRRRACRCDDVGLALRRRNCGTV